MLSIPPKLHVDSCDPLLAVNLDSVFCVETKMLTHRLHLADKSEDEQGYMGINYCGILKNGDLYQVTGIGGRSTRDPKDTYRVTSFALIESHEMGIPEISRVLKVPFIEHGAYANSQVDLLVGSKLVKRFNGALCLFDRLTKEVYIVMVEDKFDSNLSVGMELVDLRYEDESALPYVLRCLKSMQH